MELVNATRMVAGYTMGLEPSGRELLVVVVKGTFVLPQNGESVRLADEQVPLVMADEFTGEPGVSAPRYEVDYAPRKPKCDVLLLGSAYAPGGRPSRRVDVGLKVNGMTKSFTVVGPRQWICTKTQLDATVPEAFTTLPISYDVAFGGVDAKHEDPAKHTAFMSNPVGRGYHRHVRPDWVDGASMPNTEERGQPVSSPSSESYRPMSFGPVGRNWHPRYRLAGTYDDAWLEHHFPFLPPDFNDLYLQAAPEDQQIAHPNGGEEIHLVNLTPDGDRRFTLPVFDAPAHVFPKKGDREDYDLTLDTIVLEPDSERFTLTWRLTRPLKRNMFEVAQVMVGKRSKAWWAEREKVTFPIILRQVRSGAEDSGSPGDEDGQHETESDTPEQGD
jgi:hypothetical protein